MNNDQEILNRLIQLEQNQASLASQMSMHQHLGIDGTSQMIGQPDLKANTLSLVSRNINTGENTFPLAAYAQPSGSTSGNAFFYGVTVNSPGTANENIIGSLATGKVDSLGSNQKGGVDRGLYTAFNYHGNDTHNPPWSFIYAVRDAFVYNTTTTSASNTISIDTTKYTIAVNELVGWYVSVLHSTGETEQFKVLSNTASTITVDDTWALSDSNANVAIFVPIFLGAANYPWRRLYVGDEIRFGAGMTVSSGGVKQSTFLVKKESDTALSIGAGFGSTATDNTTLGAGFTITPATSYHIVGGTSPRISSATTAIADGSFMGQLMILEGTDDTNTITIKNGANTVLGSDITLGNYQTLVLVWDGLAWVTVSSSSSPVSTGFNMKYAWFLN